MHENYNGDDHFYNNIFAAPAKDGKSVLNEEQRPPTKPGRLAYYDDETMPLLMGGNLYLNGCIPHEKEQDPVISELELLEITLVQMNDGLYIRWISTPALVRKHEKKLISTNNLGRARVPDMSYEHADGTPVFIDTDYFGNPRKRTNPGPGPFNYETNEQQLLKVWPKSLPHRFMNK